MKCPFCQQELEVMVGLSNAVLGCPKCKHIATIGVWEELIYTRKALDVAVDALKAITVPALQVDYGMRGYTACKIIAESALTALEQKDK